MGNKNNVIEFLLFVLLKIAVCYFMLPYYSIYDTDIDLSLKKSIIGWSIYLILIYYMITKIKDPFYSLTYKFLFIIGGISTFVIYEMESTLLINFLKPVIYWFLLLLGFNISKITSITFKSTKIKNLPLILLGISFLFSVIMSGIYSGFRITLSFDDIYAYRMEMRMASLPTLLNYAFILIGGTLLPYCFAYTLSKKNFLGVAISLLSGIIVFSINGMKTWLLVYLLVIFVFLCYKYNKNRITIFLVISVIISFGVSYYQYVIYEDVTLFSLIGRIIYVPTRIGYDYITFFDNNEYLFLRESILKYFVDPPYPFHSSFYIVDGNSTNINTSQANNGLWGDAYANFSYIGLIIYPFLLVSVIKFIRISLRKADDRLLISITFILLWSAINASFFAWLLSFGVILIILINIFTPYNYTYRLKLL